MSSRPNIVFWGTPRFAIPVLDALEAAGFLPSLVITAPDKPVGRKQILTPSPVSNWATARGITVRKPAKLRTDLVDLDFSKFDVGIVAAYGKIIPQAMIDGPTHGTLNVHPSLLPKHRGASPLQSTILSGDTEAGVSIMLLDAEMDHGPIVAHERTSLENRRPTYLELESELSTKGGALLAKILPDWLENKIHATPQNHDTATYTKKFETIDGLLDLDKMSSAEIDRRVRALNPEPGTFAFFKKGNAQIRVKILETDLAPDGSLIIKTVHPDGKKPMEWKKFATQLDHTFSLPK